MPRKITSSLGVSEDTLPYIGRHTQLLPRHLGKLLNSIWLQNEKAGNDMTKPFSEKIVREGVSTAEKELASEICDSYVYKYPNLRIVVGLFKRNSTCIYVGGITYNF